MKLEGGSGRASITSPAEVVSKDGELTVKIVWSSSNYDYMIVDGTKYLNEAKNGENSTFTIPFEKYGKATKVIADTTAMSKPYEIEYKITVDAPNDNSSDSKDGTSSTASSEESVARGNITKAPTIKGLTHLKRKELSNAKEFTVDYYKDSSNNTYTLIIIGAKDQFLLIPEGGSTPKSLQKDITAIQLPLTKTYVVSSSVMDLIREIDALDGVGYTGTKSSDWHISRIASLVKNGTIQYAGKYRAPDYEMLRSGGCNLAIENTMIYHSPAVKEKLESLGIPVMVERSAYETNPMGRLEWVKLYGELYGKSTEANQFYEKQLKRYQKIASKVLDSNSGAKKVAIFAINASGGVTIRSSNDYLAKLIEQAGGEYASADSDSSSSSKATITIQMEDFYRIAKDADVLIYNSTIEGSVGSRKVLAKKSSLLKKFNAMKTGEVYSLGPDFFQNSTKLVDVMEDIYHILTGENNSLSVLTKIK